MVYYMHNNNNYQCKICWNKALTFGVGWIQLSFRIYIYHCVHPIHANMFSIQMLLHFSQIVPRVCTLVLSLLLLSSLCFPLLYIYIYLHSNYRKTIFRTQTMLFVFNFFPPGHNPSTSPGTHYLIPCRSMLL